jgi:nucleoside-diphosphate-sugar epimerase
MQKPIDLVTGGAGFIGSHLTRALLARGGAVRVIDDFSNGKHENLRELRETYPEALEVHELDIRDARALTPLCEGVRTVFHQAAVPSVQRSIQDPLNSCTANVEGSLNVLLAARDAGARKVVYASSSSVYGDTDVLPKHEGLPVNPMSPYAITKAAAEMLGKVFPRIYGLATVGLRYFNVFGPYQDPESQYAAVIPRFITRLLAGEAPIIYGDGEQTRDFTFIDNVVSANLLAAESDAAGVSVNVACGDRFSLNQLVKILNEILGTDVDPIYEEARTGDVRDSQADVSLAREEIGFEPLVSFEDGLRRTADWYREHAG